MKKCSKCGETKELDEFFKSSQSKDNHRSCCKKCDLSRKIDYIEVEYKKCAKCSKTKSNKEFSKSVNSKTGLKSHCKSCAKEDGKLYRKNNKEKQKKYREKIKDKQSKYYKEYREKNKEELKVKASKKFYANHEKYLSYGKKYREEHPDEMRKYKRKWGEKNRLMLNERRNKFNRENPHIYAWRSLLRNTLKRMGTEKEGHTVDLLGFSALELKEHLEKLFLPEMSWENYGEWHIDHIKPVSSFDKSTPANIVCALSNLQPLWATTREINGIIYEGNLNKGIIY